MMETTLSLRIPKDWMTEIAEKYGALVKVVACKKMGTRVHQLVEIHTLEGRIEEVLRAINSNRHVLATTITRVDSVKAVGCVAVSSLTPYALLLKSECTFLSGETTGEGRIIWNLLISKNKPLQELVNALRAQGISVNLQRLSRVSASEVLTARQEEILQTALDRGFFEHPKKIGLRELARAFNISASTLSETLRKGLKKNIELYIQEKEKNKGGFG
jgi:predicted DNA binding protein